MNKNSKRRLKTNGFLGNISCRLILCVLLVFVLAVLCISLCHVLTLSKKPHIYPPQEITIKYCMYLLMDRFKEAFSYSFDWSDKDKDIEATKTRRAQYEYLEYELGPIEIRKNETFDDANRVVVPMLSAKYRDRATGEITIMADPNGRDLVGIILEKQNIIGESIWRVIDGPKKYEFILSDMYKFPRKQLLYSPKIILKKAIVMQVVSEGEVVNERVFTWDKLDDLQMSITDNKERD